MCANLFAFKELVDSFIAEDIGESESVILTVLFDECNFRSGDGEVTQLFHYFFSFTEGTKTEHKKIFQYLRN